MSRRLILFAFGASAIAPAQVFAHHSRASYDLTQEIVIEGTVARLMWANPHIFMTVATDGAGGDARNLEIEVTSVSEAPVLGLRREAIAPGARVVVRAHPGRSAGTHAVGIDVTTSDGTVYPLNTDAKFAIRPAAVKAQGIAGRWAPTIESFTAYIAAIPSWPLTEAGRAKAEAERSARDSTSVAVLGICEPYPPPVLSLFPDLRTIDVTATTVVMRFEGGIGLEMERIVHLDQSEHPADLTPSLMGHSIGRWEGESLVVDTAGFSPSPVGVSLYIPSGPRKHLVERLTLGADRSQVEYTVTLDDPDILAEPVSYAASWDFRPDLEPSSEVCDPDVARHPLVQ
jgi:hypothetical protein